MRTIVISTDTFAAIWSHRGPGEETEEAILRRILGIESSAPDETHPSSQTRGGFDDGRNGVHFPEGFEIFRTYKGKEYRAQATGGKWLLVNDGVRYRSLHKLSSAVVTGNENSWNNWKYRLPDGGEAFIRTLRDETKIVRRTQ